VKELAHLEPLHLEDARARFGTRISDEELLLRLTMPPEQVDAMRQVGDATPSAAAPLRRQTPVETLFEELEQRTSVREVRVEKAGDVVEWRRGA